MAIACSHARVQGQWPVSSKDKGANKRRTDVVAKNVTQNFYWWLSAEQWILLTQFEPLMFAHTL